MSASAHYTGQSQITNIAYQQLCLLLPTYSHQEILAQFQLHTDFEQTQAHAYRQTKAVKWKHVIEMYKKYISCKEAQ